MEDHSIDKVTISGPALASMIQRFSTSPGSVDGLILGHVSHILPTLTDDSPNSTSSATLIATVTAFFCSASTLSFYNSSGRVDPIALRRLTQAQQAQSPSSHLLGWFSGRLRTHLRPSLREFSVSNSLSSIPNRNIPIQGPSEGSDGAPTLTPSLFLLFASPASIRRSTLMSTGPTSSVHPSTHSSPNGSKSSTLGLRSEPITGISALARRSQICTASLGFRREGLDVGSLSRLMGSEATNYTAGVEDLYEKMLVKIETLTRLVEQSSAKVLEQENHNRKLRYKASRSVALK
ncbi:hypothetical protein ACFX1R_011179 [Malus domestica]